MGTIEKQKPRNFSISGFAKLIRIPNLAIIALTQYLTAIFLIGGGSNPTFYLTDIKLFFLCLSTVIIAAAGYIINDYYDVKIDFINKPERVVVDKIIKRRVVMVAHTFLNFSGIILVIFVSYKIAVINFLSAVLLWLYSNHLKRLPFIGNFVVSLLTGASLIVIALYYSKNEFLVYTYAIFAFSITLIREIIKDIEDLKGDEVFGCKTLPVIWGVRKTKAFIYFLSLIFILLLFFLSLLIQNDILTNYFLLLIIPIIYFIYRLAIADTIREYAILSNYCKIMMLSGILSMIFFYT